MTALRGGFDLLLTALGVVAWGFAAFVIGSRLFSEAFGSVLGVGLFFAALGLAVSMHVQDLRFKRLAAGVCPCCRAPVQTDHRHRRFDAATGDWLAPSTAWDCRACGYTHGESWACPGCAQKP